MVVLIIVIVIVVLLALGLWGLFNGLVRKRNRTQEAWSEIDVELKRRHDLIPNLVSTVQGYATHEQGTFENVTRARANAVSAGARPAIPTRSHRQRMLCPEPCAHCSRWRRTTRSCGRSRASSSCRRP